MSEKKSETADVKRETEGFTEYEPYGEGWKKEMMRLNKSEIIDLFAELGKKGNHLPIGTLRNDAYFLRQAFGEAKNDEGDVQYEMSVHAGRGIPIIVSPATRRSFTIGWSELIDLAQKAGIDKPKKESK